MVCAIALFSDGRVVEELSAALGVDKERGQELIVKGANEQAAGTMGYMKNRPIKKDSGAK